MIAATGASTRFLSYFLTLPKTYTAEITLGSETDTLDTEGDVIQRKPVPPLNNSLLAAIAAKFTGEIEQIPPLFSNVKIDGQRAHKAARQGETLALRPRRVYVHSLALSLAMEFHSGPVLMRCTVSSGTYIRSLARDIALALGTCGYLSRLRRVSIGDFSAGENPPPEPCGLILSETPDFEALPFFGVVTVSETEAKKFLNGMPLQGVEKADGIYRIRTESRFLGLAHIASGVLRVEKIYSTQPEA